jgi:hypothetical protein
MTAPVPISSPILTLLITAFVGSGPSSFDFYQKQATSSDEPNRDRNPAAHPAGRCRRSRFWWAATPLKDCFSLPLRLVFAQLRRLAHTQQQSAPSFPRAYDKIQIRRCHR